MYKAHLEMLNKLHSAIIYSAMELIGTQIRKAVKVIIATHTKKFDLLFSKQHKPDNIDCKHRFYKRIAKYTNIRLSKDEEDLLSKGLKYNLPNFNNKNVLLWEITNAEAVIKCIHIYKRFKAIYS